MKQVVVAYSVVSGGAESYLVHLYTALREMQDDPALIGQIPGWEQANLARTPAPLGPKWGRRTLVGGIARLPTERKAIQDLIRRHDPDLVHMQFKREQLAFTGFAARSAPVVWTEHGRLPQGRGGQALGRLYGRAARHVAAIICVSAAVRDDVRAAVGSGVRTEVIENAVDTRRFRPPTSDERTAARASLDLPEDEEVVAWVGRLHSNKLPFLAAEVGRRFGGTMLMAGTGPELARLRAETAGGRVRVLGHLDDSSVVYRAADALVFTSTGQGEGFPMVLLEAAAMGLPIVGNHGSGMGDLIVAAGGIVVEDDAARLTDALAVLSRERESRSQSVRGWAELRDTSRWIQAHREVMGSVEMR